MHQVSPVLAQQQYQEVVLLAHAIACSLVQSLRWLVLEPVSKHFHHVCAQTDRPVAVLLIERKPAIWCKQHVTRVCMSVKHSVKTSVTGSMEAINHTTTAVTADAGTIIAT